MCVMYYILQNRQFHVPKKTNLFEIERFSDFFCVQPSVHRLKNLIGVNLAYNEQLPLFWFYRHLLTL